MISLIILGTILILIAVLTLMAAMFEESWIYLFAAVFCGIFGAALLQIAFTNQTKSRNKTHNIVYSDLKKQGFNITTSQIFISGNKFYTTEVDVNESGCTFPLFVQKFNGTYRVFLPSSSVGGGDKILTPTDVNRLATVCAD